MDDVCNGDSNACDEKTINDYVEGVTGNPTYTAYYDGKDWRLKFSKFKDFKGTKFKVDDEVTEANMKKTLDGK